MNIALIDDDHINHFILAKLIDKLGQPVTLLSFHDAQSALAYIVDNPTAQLPQLILLDINMPLMDGWQFLEALSELGRTSYNPIIHIFSSSKDPKDLDRSQRCKQVSGYLSKPISPSTLNQIISGLKEITHIDIGQQTPGLAV